MAYKSLKEIAEQCNKEVKEFWQIVIENDMKERNVSYEQSFEQMTKMFNAMDEADKNYNPEIRSPSGLSGGDGAKLEAFRKQPNRLIGDFMTEVMEKAVNAIIASQLTKAGIKSKIPADEVIESMRRIGQLVELYRAE